MIHFEFCIYMFFWVFFFTLTNIIITPNMALLHNQNAASATLAVTESLCVLEGSDNGKLRVLLIFFWVVSKINEQI